MPGQLEELKGIIVIIVTIVIIVIIVIILIIVIIVIIVNIAIMVTTVNIFMLICIFPTKVARCGAEVDVSSDESATARPARRPPPPHVLPLQLLLLLWRPGSLVMLAQELFT